jgi:hypothetical protein
MVVAARQLGQVEDRRRLLAAPVGDDGAGGPRPRRLPYSITPIVCPGDELLGRSATLRPAGSVDRLDQQTPAAPACP